ncbi:hypothetical protein LCM4577_06960 [Mesorhizobium sp. LCM 4577]|nr:hypothetical protein LCM4577_06960 [Mesorhizobium sp. LCM 4577]
MKLIRRFEEKILDLEKAGLIHGPAHSSIGQEAAAVGAVSMLRANDQINGTHRAHHYDPSVFPDPERFDINRIHAGLTTFGKGIHICPGRHLGVMLIRVLLDVFLEKDIEVELSGDRVTWIPRHMVNQLSAMPAIVKRRTG